MTSAAFMATDSTRENNVPCPPHRGPVPDDEGPRPRATAAATPTDAEQARTDESPLARELRNQARAVGDRLKESLNGQVTGRVVRGVSRLIRHLGARHAPEADPGDPAPAAAAPTAPPTPPPADEPADKPPPAVDEETLLAQFRQRRQAREARRAQRQRDRDSAAATGPAPEPLAAVATPPPEPDDRPAPAAEPAANAPTPPARPPGSDRLPLHEGAFQLPSVDLLAVEETVTAADPEEIEQNRRIIQETLDSFAIDAEVGAATRGPRVTLYEVSVSRGVKVEAISHIANNLAMELAAISLRILAPVPGQDYVGIEVPNRDADTVRLGNLLRGDLWARSRAEIPLMMGRNIHGADVILDLAKAPHLLVAGATGSGKSVCLNAAILSLLCRFSPRDLRLILVDPKIVEFSVYNALPHLVVPVISNVATVVLALRWLLHEMERRYRLLAAVGARHLQGFNSRPPESTPLRDRDGEPVPEHLPYIVLVIDELADLMMTARQDVETSLARLAQMSRAVGIHTIIATQRPSVNVITGVIKANFPTRVAFQVASQVDSRTIIDFKGAEALLGRGDMLFKPPGVARLQRLQGPMVADSDIEAVAAFASAQGTAQTDFSLLKIAADDGSAVESGNSGDEALDEMLVRQAIEIVVRDRRASTSYLQRRLRIGYNRAASIMECLEQRGIIGPSLGAGPREILVDSLSEAPGEDS